MEEDPKKKRYVANIVLVYIIALAVGMFMQIGLDWIGFGEVKIYGIKIPLPKIEYIPLIVTAIIPLFVLARFVRFNDLDKKAWWI